MLKAFEEVSKNVHFKPKLIQIDGPIFKLHYIFTFGVLLICTILVSSQQYIGEHIRCIADVYSALDTDKKVIETFCFFTSTYTVVRHLGSNSTSGMVPHPGVGPYIEDEPVIRHAYYQWVPFVLFGQALMFYVPHLVWKKLEGGRIKSMAAGFEYAALSSTSVATKIGDAVTIPSHEERTRKIERVSTAVWERLNINKSWANGLVFCELLCIVNLVVQVWAMDAFLGGQFMGLGQLVTGSGPEDMSNPMDVVFPKVTKCNFHKYGPSGSIQRHDALCVMALNVINEKIYAFLWFWFIILFTLTMLSLFYRVLSIVMSSRSVMFNCYTFRYCCPVLLDPISMRTLTQRCDYSDWVFLRYLALSMDGFVFRDIIDTLAVELEEEKLNNNGQEDHMTPIISSTEQLN